MQATNVLFLRALATKIHSNPLPLTDRASQQLLNLLNSSFQSHLDRYHPITSESAQATDRSTTDTNSVSLSRSPLSTRPEQNGVPKSSQASTAEHLLEILNHPLLAKKPRRNSFTKKPGTPVQDLQPADALPWLEEKFSSAIVSLADITRCLKGLCGSSRYKVSETRRNFLQELGASRKIESWVRAGGHLSEADLYNTSTVRLPWLKLLVVEGRRDIVRIIMSRRDYDHAALVSSYLVVEGQHGAGFESAIKIFLDLKMAIPTLSISRCTRPLIHWLPAYAKSIPDTLYDKFAESLRRTQYPVFDAALLALFHPTQSKTGPAFRIVTGLTTEDAIHRHTSTPAKRQLMVSMVLRLAHCLIEQKQLADAQKILQFAQTHFSKELDITKAASIAKHVGTKTLSTEQEYMRCLDALLAT